MQVGKSALIAASIVFGLATAAAAQAGGSGGEATGAAAGGTTGSVGGGTNGAMSTGTGAMKSTGGASTTGRSVEAPTMGGNSSTSGVGNANTGRGE